jgi:hypothetical protein
MTKAEEVRQKVDALVAGGTPKAEAFRQLAKEYGQPVSSLRGAYSRGKPGGSATPRRRETTAEDALADARKALERAIEAIDREVATAEERAAEARAEADALSASAEDRKAAITKRLEALT